MFLNSLCNRQCFIDYARLGPQPLLRPLNKDLGVLIRIELHYIFVSGQKAQEDGSGECQWHNQDCWAEGSCTNKGEHAWPSTSDHLYFRSCLSSSPFTHFITLVPFFSSLSLSFASLKSLDKDHCHCQQLNWWLLWGLLFLVLQTNAKLCWCLVKFIQRLHRVRFTLSFSTNKTWLSLWKHGDIWLKLGTKSIWIGLDSPHFCLNGWGDTKNVVPHHLFHQGTRQRWKEAYISRTVIHVLFYW